MGSSYTLLPFGEYMYYYTIEPDQHQIPVIGQYLGKFVMPQAFTDKYKPERMFMLNGCMIYHIRLDGNVEIVSGYMTKKQEGERE